jgi:two-component system, NtrC family, nitrogen regulation sensor histidine kinase NtrY
MRATNILQYRKDPRLVVGLPLLVVVALSLVYYLMQNAQELTPEAMSSRVLLFALWNVNLILVLGIGFVMLRAVIKIVVERQRGVIGSRFRTKLVATYVATSLVPIVLLFIVATDLLRVSIDRWFNLPVRTIVSNSGAIAASAQERALAEALRTAEEIADSAGGGANVDRVLARARRYHNVDAVGIYEGGVVTKLLGDPRAPIHELPEPSPRFLAEVAAAGSAWKIDVGPGGSWLRQAVAIPSKEGEPRIAVAAVFVPAVMSRMIDETLIAQKNFEQLEAQRPALKASQTSLFLTVTLFLLFGALWTAIIVSRRITTPIHALATGTATLARGNYDYRIELRASDEFGLLIDSFNKMAAQLESQRAAVGESTARLEEERVYLATVLESVSTGIISFTEDLRVASVNEAAERILGISEDPLGRRFDELFQGELAGIASALGAAFSGARGPREVTIFRGAEVRYLDVAAARLAGAAPGGWVVAIEETTELVRAQKLAAWSEAARRIAHEIKNPLTPIQLSAERIARRFRDSDSETGRVIEEGCRTIVAEVAQLKRMVDEFSRFARMPAVHLEETSIGDIVRQLANLYAEVKPGVTVTAAVDPFLRAVVDGQQIRRALINLLDNAIDATDAGEISIRAAREERKLVIEVADPGRGVPEPDKERLFLPHFSTKERGTGLGLAIVHRIVTDHDGRITVSDNRPSGTRFEIEIPA